MSPTCDYADTAIEVNTDYLRELDGSMKKVPQHFKENLASTQFMPGSSTTVTMGSPAVQASAYDFSSYIVKKNNKNSCSGGGPGSCPKLTVKTYFFANATTVNGFPVDAMSFKFDFVIDNWNWDSSSNSFQLGMLLTITGASIPTPPMVADPTNGVHAWDFGNFKFSTPTTNGATCGGQPCDAVVSMNVDTTIYCNGIPTQGGCGPAPGPQVETSKQEFMIDYYFPTNFGNSLVYDPIITAVPVSNSGGGSSSGGGTGGTGGTSGTSGTNSDSISNVVSGAVSGMSGIVLAALVVVVMAALAGVGALAHRAVQARRTPTELDSEAAMMEMVTAPEHLLKQEEGHRL